MNPATLLFDLDGTLTDSRSGICNCITYALEEMDISSPPHETLARYIGPPLTAAFAELIGNDGERIQQAITLYRERFRSVGLYENDLYAGILPMLDRLQCAGHQMYVATTKPQIFAERIVDHFGIAPYFSKVYGSELDGTRAHKGDLIGFILAREGLDAQSTCMIGDREHDMLGAGQHRLGAIGVLWGYGTVEELRAAKAGWLVDQPTDLPALVLNGMPPTPHN